MESGPGTPITEGAGPDPSVAVNPLLVRLRLDVSYDGTDFSGWAAQPGRRTVAGVLRAELQRLFGDGGAVGLTVAGRTDAGVHASGQVAHVDVTADGWVRLGDTLVRRLAGLLPQDVRVVGVTQMPESFDARFSALSRRYVYRVTDMPWGGVPLRARDTLAWPRPLDIDVMNEAATTLVGLHDFVAFCRRKDHASTIRAVNRFDWRRDDDGVLVASVAADAFCQSMVRSLVGALIAVGEGRRPVTWPIDLLRRTERASDVVVAPAHGLNLVEVIYPDESAYADRAAQTRNRRDLE
jgi:tRNA pseudouridine38-40 synthase